MYLSHFIVAVAFVSVFTTYMRIAQMKGQLALQIIRYLHIPAYFAIVLAFSYVPSIMGYSLGFITLLWLVDVGAELNKSYTEARAAEQQAEWLKQLRFAPYVLAGLIFLYGVNFRSVRELQPAPPTPAVQPDTLYTKPENEELTNEQIWNDTKKKRGLD